MSSPLKPRPAVEHMAPYHPPSGGRSGKLRLDFNENTIGCSPKVIEYLRDKLTADSLSIYPEYLDTVRELASYFAVAPGELQLTNGTDEAIQILVNTFVDDGDEVLILKPSYAMYRFYAELAGAKIREIDYQAGSLAFPLERFLKSIGPHTKAILIANPNNARPARPMLLGSGMYTVAVNCPVPLVWSNWPITPARSHRCSRNPEPSANSLREVVVQL